MAQQEAVLENEALLQEIVADLQSPLALEGLVIGTHAPQQELCCDYVNNLSIFQVEIDSLKMNGSHKSGRTCGSSAGDNRPKQ